MAMYAVRCLRCGKDDDQYHRMPEAGGAPQFDACATCGGAVRKLVTPVGEVGTGNRMHHIVDRTMCSGFEPVVFNTRSEWEGEMKRRGLRPMEPGDGAQQVRSEIERGKRCEEQRQKQFGEQFDKAFDKAINTVGGI